MTLSRIRALSLGSSIPEASLRDMVAKGRLRRYKFQGHVYVDADELAGRIRRGQYRKRQSDATSETIEASG